jgi:hypothetical protein
MIRFVLFQADCQLTQPDKRHTMSLTMLVRRVMNMFIALKA